MRKSIRAIYSYRYHHDHEFSRQIDYFHLGGQDNILRYLPVGKLIVRLHENDSLFETLARIAAAKISGNKLWVSIPKGLNNSVTRFLQGKKGLLIENIGWAMLAQNQEIRLFFYLDIPTGFGHTRVHITVPFRS